MHIEDRWRGSILLASAERNASKSSQLGGRLSRIRSGRLLAGRLRAELKQIKLLFNLAIGLLPDGASTAKIVDRLASDVHGILPERVIRPGARIPAKAGLVQRFPILNL